MDLGDGESRDISEPERRLHTIEENLDDEDGVAVKVAGLVARGEEELGRPLAKVTSTNTSVHCELTVHFGKQGCDKKLACSSPRCEDVFSTMDPDDEDP